MFITKKCYYMDICQMPVIRINRIYIQIMQTAIIHHIIKKYMKTITADKKKWNMVQ